jgi:hypothetical protein
VCRKEPEGGTEGTDRGLGREFNRIAWEKEFTYAGCIY